MSDKEKNNEQIPDLNEVKQIKKGYESLKDKALFKLNETKRLFNEKVNAVADKTKNFIDKHGKEILLTLFATTAIYGGINHIGNLTYNNKTVDSNVINPGAVTGNTNPDAEKDVDEVLDDMGYGSDKDNNKKSNKKTQASPEEKVETTYESNGNTKETKTQTTKGEDTTNIKVNDEKAEQEQNKKIEEDVNAGKTKTELKDGVEATTSKNEVVKKDTTQKNGTVEVKSEEAKTEKNQNNTTVKNNVEAQSNDTVSNTSSNSTREVKEATDIDLEDLLR